METFELHPSNIDLRALGRISEILRRGQLVVYPTDTHPALGCNALNGAAITTLCRLKGVNPEKQTLSIVCSSLSQASAYARIDNRAFSIMRANLPGPFTFILPASTSLPKIFKGRKQVGIRIPANSIARAMADDLGNPLLSGSIGDTDPYDFEHSAEAIIKDSDACDFREIMSSAIIDLTDSAAPVILREGPVTPEL